MARLPQPGGDQGTWGAVLNEFLQVSHNPDGTLKSFVSVKDFGAKGDGVTDDTIAIQNAINNPAIATVIVPAGTYIVTNTLLIATLRHLHLLNGATIRGKATTTKPVIRIFGSQATLSGEGMNSVVTTDNVTGNPSDVTTEGIINIGPLTKTSQANINWSRISNIQIAGSYARYNTYIANSANNAIDSDIGIKMVNAAYLGTGSNSLYNCVIEQVFFHSVGIGIDMTPIVQGNNFNNLYFYRISKYGFQMEGCNENSVSQTFFHASAGVTYSRLKTVPANASLYANRGSMENSFIAFNGEPGATGPLPGNRASRVYEIDSGCVGNFFQGNLNTGHVNIDNSAATTTILQGIIISNKSAAFAGVQINEGAPQPVNGTGGVILFVEGGSLKAKKADGTIVTIA